MPIFKEKVQVQNSTESIDKILLYPDGYPHIRVKDVPGRNSIIVNGGTRTLDFYDTADKLTITIDGANRKIIFYYGFYFLIFNFRISK